MAEKIDEKAEEREREQERAALAWMRAQARALNPQVGPQAGALECSRVISACITPPTPQPAGQASGRELFQMLERMTATYHENIFKLLGAVLVEGGEPQDALAAAGKLGEIRAALARHTEEPT